MAETSMINSSQQFFNRSGPLFSKTDNCFDKKVAVIKNIDDNNRQLIKPNKRANIWKAKPAF